MASKRRTNAPRAHRRPARGHRLAAKASKKVAAKQEPDAPTKKAKPKVGRPSAAITGGLRAGTEPSVRIFTDWTVQKIRQAEIAADSGNIRLAADLCEWILADDRVSGLLHTRVQSLLGLEPQFEKAGDKRRSGVAVNALDAKNDWTAAYPESELTQMMVWGLLLGVAPLRHGWTRDEEHGNRLLPNPIFWHPQHLRQDPGTRQWKTKIAAVGSAQGVIDEVDINAGDGTWIFHTPYGTNRPIASGMWRGLARWVLLKHLAMGDLSRVSEKAGLLTVETQPAMVSTQAAYKTTLEERMQLADDLYERGREGVAVLPPGYNAKLIESMAGAAMFKTQIDMANEAFAIRIRGGNLTTQVSAGSLAAAEVQERTGEDANRRFDAITTSVTIRQQSLIWWAQFNFGDRRLAPFPVYPVRGAEDLLKKAQALDVAMDGAAKAKRSGYELDRLAFADDFMFDGFLVPDESIPNPGSEADRKLNPEPPATPPTKPAPAPVKGAVPPEP